MDNNSILYSDSKGDIAIIDDFIIGYAKGLLMRDISAINMAKKQVKNSALLWSGLLTTDRNKSFVYRGLTIISRLTWEAPQTFLGFLSAHVINTVGNINVENNKGGTYIQIGRRKTWGALTIGSYMFGDSKFLSTQGLKEHEFGHVLQSRIVGPTYLLVIGASSIIRAGIWKIFNSKKSYHSYYTERWANILSRRYRNRR